MYFFCNLVTVTRIVYLMLNYIWVFLLAAGIFTAAFFDINDSINDKYLNNSSLEIIVKNDSGISVSNIKIGNESVELVSKYFTDSLLSKASIILYINENSPEILKNKATVSGNKNDISGTVIIESVDTNYIKGHLILEKSSFINLKKITDAALEYAGISVEIAMGLIGIMSLWLGIMKIGEEAGLINIIAKMARPLMKFLFPDIPDNHPAIGSMIMNISATFLGLGNAATPFGIKAMEDLNTLNDKKDTATNAMCTFLVINTASFALMPTTAIALRASAGSTQPALIIGTTMFASFTATVVGLIMVKLFENFPLSKHKIGTVLLKGYKKLLTLFFIVAGLYLLSFTGIYSVFSLIDAEFLKSGINLISNIAIPFVIFSFLIFGIKKRVKIYETFVEGAKEGFNVAVTIIPFLVAILISIGIFRASGGMDLLVYILSPLTTLIGFPAEALPMALMRPLSGSGSLGIMAEIIAVHGPDSFIGILVSTFFGSTETTFYVLAVYFGAVNIKNTRHALPAGLISDVAGILAALFIVKLIYG